MSRTFYSPGAIRRSEVVDGARGGVSAALSCARHPMDAGRSRQPPRDGPPRDGGAGHKVGAHQAERGQDPRARGNGAWWWDAGGSLQALAARPTYDLSPLVTG